MKFLKRFRYSSIILRQLVITDFKLRYQASALGYLWSLLHPLALFVILYFVFVRFLKVGGTIPHFPVYLLLGIVIWNFFVEVTSGSVGAVVGKGDLLRKINFPKYVVVLSGAFAALINLALNLLVVGIFAFFNNVDISPRLLLVPLLITELFVLALAFAFLLSAAYVRLRDINYIWEVIMQGAFYATPILYPLDSTYVSALTAKIMLLNPMAQIIQDLRYCIVTDQAVTIGSAYGNPLMRLVPILGVILFALFAALYFRRRSPNFAEEV